MAARAVVGDVVEGRLVARCRRAPRRGSGRATSASSPSTVSTRSRGEHAAPRPSRPARPARTRSRGRRRPRRSRSASTGSSSRRAAGRRPEAATPGSRRSARRLGDRQLHVDRRVLDVVVAERDLVRGERGAAARAVGDDLVALVEAAVVPDLPQRPPDRLDVVVRRASRRGRRGRSRSRSARSAGSSPRRSGRPTRGSAALNSAIPYSSISAFEEIPSSFSTSSSTGRPWQSQPRLARHAVARHRPVARVDVLEDAREDVVGAGWPLAVGGPS